MKVTEQFIRRLTISEVLGLDPIRVMLEDIGPNQGRINIECYGQSWACFWGSMGGTIAEFFTRCDEHYLAGKLSSIPARVFNPDGLKDKLKREVVSDRRKWFSGKAEARRRFDRIEDLDLPSSVEECWHMSDTLEEVLGQEWWYSMPEKANPDYEYLTRIIKAVQAALREVKTPAASSPVLQEA